jgi:Zn-finger nucleic acid-binding protein
MQCPHCFLEMQLIVQNNDEISKCPGCEGLWLYAESIENIVDLNIEQSNTCNKSELEENVAIDLQSDKDYFFYKKPFSKNANPDDLYGFE